MGGTYGKIHSVETLGTRDGPGLRCVFFFAGCNFRCRFCHNPDTFTDKGSGRMNIEQAQEKLKVLIPYLKAGKGGITASGGEPTLQPRFLKSLFTMAHRLGLTTALDTNGSCPQSSTRQILKHTDTVLLDVKASHTDLHRKLTGHDMAPTLKFGKVCAEMKNTLGTPDLIIRRVVLPGINDSAGEIRGLIDYILSLPARPSVELIPYHVMGKHKWAELGLKYTLQDLQPPGEQLLNRIKTSFTKAQIKVY